MPYVIKDNQSKTFYSSWSAIGPCFGASLQHAASFPTKVAAVKLMGQHSIAFVRSTVKEFVLDDTKKRRIKQAPIKKAR